MTKMAIHFVLNHELSFSAIMKTVCMTNLKNTHLC